MIRERELQHYEEFRRARQETIETQDALLANSNYSLDFSDLTIPDPRPHPHPAKPLLLIIPPELIEQWASEIRRFSSKFRPMIYYGDKRSSLNSTIPKVDGLLNKGSPYFKGSKKNSRAIIITSLPTLVARHGPALLRYHCINKKGWEAAAVNTIFHVPDTD